MGMNSAMIHSYIERLSNLLRNEIRKSGVALGLQPVQIEALHYLSQCNRYSDSPMGVTDYLGQTKGTVSQSLKVLEKKGLITKVTDSKDRRVTHLRVSESGRAFLRNAVPSAMFAKLGDYLGAETEAEISAALKNLLLGIQQANGMKSFGVCHTCRHCRLLDDGTHLCGLTREALSSADTQLICREHEAGDKKAVGDESFPAE